LDKDAKGRLFLTDEVLRLFELTAPAYIVSAVLDARFP